MDKEKEENKKDFIYIIDKVKEFVLSEIELLENSQIVDYIENLYSIRKEIFSDLESNKRFKR